MATSFRLRYSTRQRDLRGKSKIKGPRRTGKRQAERLYTTSYSPNTSTTNHQSSKWKIKSLNDANQGLCDGHQKSYVDYAPSSPAVTPALPGVPPASRARSNREQSPLAPGIFTCRHLPASPNAASWLCSRSLALDCGSNLDLQTVALPHDPSK
jgi:hypothetical protein